MMILYMIISHKINFTQTGRYSDNCVNEVCVPRFHIISRLRDFTVITVSLVRQQSYFFVS